MLSKHHIVIHKERIREETLHWCLINNSKVMQNFEFEKVYIRKEIVEYFILSIDLYLNNFQVLSEIQQ